MKKIKFKTVSKIKKKGYPTASPNYKKAHRKANAAEKKADPREYKEMKKVDRKIPADELAGTHTKDGKIKVSKKVPKRDRAGVALHEFVEHKADPGTCKKCGKGKNGH